MSWRDALQPASFRGIPFEVEVNARGGGRRGFVYEFAKSDNSLDEDLGRRVRRINVSAYLIGADYDLAADALEAALESEGGGLLVLPTMGQQRMRCEAYTRSERREAGGFATFEIGFVTSNTTQATPTPNTQAAVRAQAQTAQAQIDISAGDDSDWS